MSTMDVRPARFGELHAESLVEQIRARVRDAILSGELDPGEKLRDSVIAADMGVSRAPVREALRSLQESGLIEKLPNRSYQVTTFDTEEWDDLANMRVAYEVLAVRQAVARGGAVDQLVNALDRMREAAAIGDDVAIIAADWLFHDALVQASGNRLLITAYSRLRDLIQHALLANVRTGRGVISGIVERHDELLRLFVQAVKQGDPNPVIDVLEDHVAAGMGVVPLP